MEIKNRAEKKVLIADDHNLILDGISVILGKAFAFGAITAVTEGKEVCKEIKKQQFDLYILDLELKDMSGFELIKIIRDMDTDSRIIINTMHEEIWNIKRLMEMNINGIVLKSSASKHIVEATASVLSGKEYFCPRFSYLKSHHSVCHRNMNGKNSLPTPQEKLVLKYIVQGYTTQEIADKLSVTDNTIETHRKNLFLKLGARNVAQLVSIGINSGLVD